MNITQCQKRSFKHEIEQLTSPNTSMKAMEGADHERNKLLRDLFP